MSSNEINERSYVKQHESNIVVVRFKRITVAKLDEIVEKKGFRNRQDIIREAVRKYLEGASK